MSGVRLRGKGGRGGLRLVEEGRRRVVLRALRECQGVRLRARPAGPVVVLVELAEAAVALEGGGVGARGVAAPLGAVLETPGLVGSVRLHSLLGVVMSC